MRRRVKFDQLILPPVLDGAPEQTRVSVKLALGRAQRRQRSHRAREKLGIRQP